MKTMIAVPCMDTVPVDFVKSILYMEKPAGVSVCFHQSSLIYDARNLLSLTAIEGGYDRVLWLDSDVVFDKNTMNVLSADMDTTGADMVSGVYVKRHFPSVPVIYELLDEPMNDGNGHVIPRIKTYDNHPGGLFRIQGCGFGCVMTSVPLLKKVWDSFGPAFAPLPWAGEDIAFCHRVNLLGYKIYCDANVSCGHVGTYVFTERDVKR